MASDVFDHDLTSSNIGRGETPLDRLKAVIEKDVTREPVLLEVPARDNVAVRISPNITSEQLRAWRQRARIKGSQDDVDMVKVACLTIGSLCKGIVISDEDVVDEAGNHVNFASAEIWQMTGAQNAIDAVRKFYGNDAHLVATLSKIQELSGWGEDVEEEDANPTSLS